MLKRKQSGWNRATCEERVEQGVGSRELLEVWVLKEKGQLV